MASQNIIIFGPTGQVASSAAIHASTLGAKIYLAMRDTTKPIPSLSPAHEQSGNFQRIQADLADPPSIITAVKESQATTAFLYRIHVPTMKPTFQALKDGGITFVVFLSSNFVQNPKESYLDPKNLIPWLHATAEVELEGVFGKGNYVAVRPAWFASNTSQWSQMIKKKGEVVTISEKVVLDPIAPEDIGKVCGALVAGGKEKAEGKDFIRICGPKLMPVKDIVGDIEKVVGKEIKVREVDEEGFVDAYVQFAGLPESIARVLAANLQRRNAEVAPDEMYGEQYKESAGSILKYGGSEPTEFRAWVEGNKDSFL